MKLETILGLLFYRGPAEQNYTANDRGLLGILYFFTKAKLSRKEARWLETFDISEFFLLT